LYQILSLQSNLPFNYDEFLGVKQVCWQYFDRNYIQIYEQVQIWFMVFNATFNNISAISCQSVLLVEENGIPGENYQPVASH
jgi:hypothetical protein